MNDSETKPKTTSAKRRTRSGGRAANTARRGGELFKQSPWRIPVNQDPPIEPLPEEGVEAIHDGAMKILENIGIEFLNEEAQELLPKQDAELKAAMSEWTGNG
ncbi:MAG: hypothetical protein CM15mP66_11530 [Pseudomonadota bacterium]|nr:MAG: hypothetical protein CM15mP66_11530 [Pseudomonadota bacterium]